ncbi:MAG: hypothetical protein DRH24_20520 [Deltaproteobacteria bacterium]|nr:MAG: hypothetical protein DRH24_20520 [Deltaproteobacteria bacterium]
MGENPSPLGDYLSRLAVTMKNYRKTSHSVIAQYIELQDAAERARDDDFTVGPWGVNSGRPRGRPEFTPHPDPH